MPTLTHAESERVISSMVDQAVYAAKLLSGELPPSIEDVFAPLGLRLFPSESGDLTPKCNCRDVAPADPGSPAPLPEFLIGSASRSPQRGRIRALPRLCR